MFARFPEPGVAKTRLIPAFGEVRAAAIHRLLAHKTIQLASRFASQRGCQVTIYFTGRDQRAMELDFGNGQRFIEQVGNDLGNRLAHATDHAFSIGAQRVVVIGTDCYELQESHLNQAFSGLATHDVVLGPATDGGYYLIGLKDRKIPIFEGIEWGSSHVFEQTTAIIREYRKSLWELQSLPDVDFPEDVLPLRRSESNGVDEIFSRVRGRLSIIIPALNEASSLPSTLRSMGPPNESLEIIVVDGGSTDDTVAIARDFGAKSFVGNPGRSKQMNAGAAVATGDTLLFLHADTQLPLGYFANVANCVDEGNIAGAFRLRIDGHEFGLRLVEWGANARSRLLRFPYGDQALFMRASTFFELKGYRSIPIMEDFDLVQRIRRMGAIKLLGDSILTSGRRWKAKGILKTLIVNQICIVAFWLGISPTQIVKFYRNSPK